jgi:thymidine kinase
MAELIFKYGTMSSGKSLNLLSTAHQFKTNNIKYQLFKSAIDTRTKDTIKSRIGIEENCIAINQCESFYNHIKSDTKWLLVDEAQFLTKEQIYELSQIVDTYNINVICYGLRTDYLNRLFEGSKTLFEISDIFEELPSYCECGNKTSVNARIGKNGEIDVSEGKQIEVGGDERYKSICRKCYHNLIKNKQ